MPRGGLDVEPPTDPESIDVHDVYAHYGLAMYQVQCVEYQLVILSPMLHGMHPSRTTRQDLDNLWDSLLSNTFGQVIQQLARTVGLPEGFEERLRKALKLRNWLAHNYFRERAPHFVSLEGRARMRAELSSAADSLAALDEELTELGKAYRRSIGITDETVQNLMNKLIANPDSDPDAA